MWYWKRQSFTENSPEITLAHSSSRCSSWPWRSVDAMVWDRLFLCSFVILAPYPLSLHILFLVQLSSCFLRYLWPPLLLFLPRGGRRCPSNRIKKSFEESAQRFWPLVPSKYHQRLLWLSDIRWTLVCSRHSQVHSMVTEESYSGTSLRTPSVF